MNSEIHTTLLLFLYQYLFTCTLYLKRNCLCICSVYKINEKQVMLLICFTYSVIIVTVHFLLYTNKMFTMAIMAFK